MIKDEVARGIAAQNPVLRLALGLCPALAVTATINDALVMGMLVLCVLAASSFAVSVTRNLIPHRVRIPCHILIVAAFASMAGILLSVRAPHASAALGIYVPLIAVNCLILDRAETYASKNKALASLVDGIGMGLGFTGALFLCSVVRELLGSFSLFGVKVIPGSHPLLALTRSCGGFFSLALVLGTLNFLRQRKEKADVQ